MPVSSEVGCSVRHGVRDRARRRVRQLAQLGTQLAQLGTQLAQLGALLAAAAACQGAPPLPLPDAEQVLAEAQRQLGAGEFAPARDLLLAYDTKDFSQQSQARYEILLAQAYLGTDEPWEAFEVLRDFADDHPHSELRDRAVDLQFRAGSALARRDGGFLFFWSDRRGARTCLEHLITRYPNCVQFADALRLLGELAMADGNYIEAEERFRELLRRHPESEWAPLARFRFAMSIVGSLQGPDYDLEKMESATKELRAFLQNPPENPRFIAEASAALDRLLDWRSRRHLGIADFYRRVGNEAGEIEHLYQATGPELESTAAAEIARQRLAALGNPKPMAARAAAGGPP